MNDPVFRIIASTRKAGTCRSCNAPITWCKTFPNQRAMPLHGNPAPAQVEENPAHGTIHVIRSADSHFSQCPQSSKWSSSTKAPSAPAAPTGPAMKVTITDVQLADLKRDWFNRGFNACASASANVDATPDDWIDVNFNHPDFVRDRNKAFAAEQAKR